MEAVAAEKNLYRAPFETLAEARRGEPEWLRRIRREAFETFAEQGFPTPSEEEWRFTRIEPIIRTPFRHAEDAPVDGAGAVKRALSALGLPDAAGRLVFVNGRIAPKLSRPGQTGVELASLRDALAADPESLEPYLSPKASRRRNVFATLNTAFLEEGALVRIPRGVQAAAPLYVVFLSAPSGPVVSHPRCVVVAEPGSQSLIVESYGGAPGVSLTNSVTEIVCGEGAVVTHVKLQREDPAAYHVQTIAVGQARDSTFTSHNLALGGAIARTDITVTLGAEGAECALYGLFVGEGSQLLDNHTVIDHAMPHGTSRELYKGILDGKARGIFHGKIIVRPGAQKTDAMQTNKNLLLSREALVNSTPALEILADDVKCRHGSTIGQLDAAALFYMRSRGIAEPEARALLTYAFAADVAERIPIAEIRESIGSHLRGMLGNPREAA